MSDEVTTLPQFVSFLENVPLTITSMSAKNFSQRINTFLRKDFFGRIDPFLPKKL